MSPTYFDGPTMDGELKRELPFLGTKIMTLRGAWRYCSGSCELVTTAECNGRTDAHAHACTHELTDAGTRIPTPERANAHARSRARTHEHTHRSPNPRTRPRTPAQTRGLQTMAAALHVARIVWSAYNWERIYVSTVLLAWCSKTCSFHIFSSSKMKRIL